jgi:hypothetical protein
VNPPAGSHKAQKALALVAKVIQDPQKRRDFVHDPQGTMEAAGGNFNDLPRRVRTFFGNLTYEELRVLAQLQETMVREEGLHDTLRGGVTLGKL